MRPDEIAFIDAYLEYLAGQQRKITPATTVTANEAAGWFGVRPSTIRSWVKRGKVAAVGRRDGSQTYSLAKLVEADRSARNSPNLRQPRSK